MKVMTVAMTMVIEMMVANGHEYSEAMMVAMIMVIAMVVVMVITCGDCCYDVHCR